MFVQLHRHIIKLDYGKKKYRHVSHLDFLFDDS